MTANATPPTQPTSWWRDYVADVTRARGRPARWHERIWMPWVNPGIRALLCYRIGRVFTRRRWSAPLGALLRRFATFTTGADIDPGARLDGGIRFPHPIGVVIGAGVAIGRHSVVFQQVTIAPRRSDASPDEAPQLEPLTCAYPGAKVLGPIRIGTRSQIGPNCVVLEDLPAGSTVLPPEPTVLAGLSFTFREPKESDSPVVETA